MSVTDIPSACPKEPPVADAACGLIAAAEFSSFQWTTATNRSQVARGMHAIGTSQAIR
jgi:hypothetical protein